MAIHCNILAWKSPWTEGIGKLQFRSLQRHNWAHNHWWSLYFSETLKYLRKYVILCGQFYLHESYFTWKGNVKFDPNFSWSDKCRIRTLEDNAGQPQFTSQVCSWWQSCSKLPCCRSRWYLCELWWYLVVFGFPGGSDGKESSCNMGDPGFIPGSERFPGGGNGHTLQYPWPEKPMDRVTWWDTVHEVTKSQTWLSN